MSIEDLYSGVIASKKYAGLHAPLVMRICEEEYPKYRKDKDRLKAVKKKLHIIYGAFNASPSPINTTNISADERASVLDEFYGFIFGFGAAGQAKSILDIGCGFNPFSLPQMMRFCAGIERYYAYDIDCGAIGLINGYFDSIGLPRLAAAMDIVAETPQDCADVAFMFKLMPVLEIQRPGRGFELLRELNAGYIAVTYPVKSLCGSGKKSREMAANYAQSFEGGIGGGFDILGKAIIGDELTYVIAHKKPPLRS